MMNEVQIISQKWPACHKIEKMYLECLNTFGVHKADFRLGLEIKGDFFYTVMI